MLQSRENVRRPGPCRFKIGQALPQEAFVDKRRFIHLIYPTSATDEVDRPPHSGTRPGSRAVLRCCRLNRTRPARQVVGPIPSAGNAPPTERRIARDYRLLWIDCAEFFNNL